MKLITDEDIEKATADYIKPLGPEYRSYAEEDFNAGIQWHRSQMRTTASPTDEEIEKYANETVKVVDDYSWGQNHGIILGAKWFRDQQLKSTGGYEV